MLRRLTTPLRFVTTALFIMFSAVVLALILPTGWQALSVQTGSMEPALSPGDLVLVRKLPPAQYQLGDVVTFINPTNRKQTITHRVVERADGPQRSVFTTKGDANASADSPISENLVVGKQVASVPYLGRVVDFTRTLPGIILLIWLPALWVIGGEFKRLSEYYKNIKPYRVFGRPDPQQN